MGPPLVVCDLEEKHSFEDLDLASDQGPEVILLALWTENRQESLTVLNSCRPPGYRSSLELGFKLEV